MNAASNPDDARHILKEVQRAQEALEQDDIEGVRARLSNLEQHLSTGHFGPGDTAFRTGGKN